MKELFLLSLWITFVVVRAFSHLLHDKKNYGTPKESSKTLTGYLREKTKKDIHHFHIGLIILLISIPLFVFKNFNLFWISLGIGISMTLDQIFPLMKLGNYFSKKMVFVSVCLHLIISIIAILI